MLTKSKMDKMLVDGIIATTTDVQYPAALRDACIIGSPGKKRIIIECETIEELTQVYCWLTNVRMQVTRSVKVKS